MLQEPQGSEGAIFTERKNDTIIFSNLEARDKRTIIGPGGLSIMGKYAETPTTYQVAGVTHLDVSSEVANDSIVISISNDEAAHEVVEWIRSRLEDVHAARAQQEELLRTIANRRR